MSLWPDTAAKMLNEQYDIYEKAREEYRKKIAAQAARIEQLEAALRVSERDATRIALEAEKVCLQNIQMKFALGYPMPADLERHVLPENPFKCGVCAARAALEEKA